MIHKIWYQNTQINTKISRNH